MEMETIDWGDAAELEISNRAGELLYKFLVWSKDIYRPVNFVQPDIDIGEPPKNWKSAHKDDVITLFVECASKGIAPPDDLVEVSRLIRGKNAASVWSAKKYMVLAKVAQKFPPPSPGDKVSAEIVQYATGLIEGMGGLRAQPVKTASGENDYRKDFRYWCKDDAFLKEWEKRYQSYRGYTPDPQFIAVAEQAIDTNHNRSSSFPR
jgi:hypothetical protein